MCFYDEKHFGRYIGTNEKKNNVSKSTKCNNLSLEISVKNKTFFELPLHLKTCNSEIKVVFENRKNI